MQNKINREAKGLTTYTPRMKTIIMALLFFIALPALLFAGVTGKISGHVTDETGEPVIGANIIVQGTYLGAATDVNGYYFINNVPPGEHIIVASAVGYSKTRVQSVLVKIDLTTKIDIRLNSTAVSLGQEVVVKAERPLVQKDLTSTSSTISAGEMKLMPVESVGQVINLQAGVVGGHFRGGRSNEVAYLVDGVSVTDAYNNGMGIDVENSSVRQMEVISGTFNAEYGQAMSGIVNIVTQEGGSRYEGSVSGYVGNFVTSHTDLFRNLDKVGRIGSKNLLFSFSGPAGLSNLTFFVTGRYYANEGHLYGKRVYNTTDDVPTMNPMDNTKWIVNNTGDGQYISMNPSTHYSGNGKLTYTLPLFKFSYGIMLDDNWNRYYDHGFSLTPDGITNHYRRNMINSFQIYHYPSNNTYQSLKFSYNYHKYYGYLYQDPFDPRYVNPSQGRPLTQYTFRSGGVQGGRYERYTKTLLAQWTLTSQLSKEHKVGIGVEGRLHEMFSHNWDLVNLTDGVVDSTGKAIFTPGYPSVGSVTDQGQNIQYTKKPREISAYIQDKMEYDIMIINAGIRLDYFDANSSNPSDLRNPRNNPDFPGAFQTTKAKAKVQLSPRLGASFPITDQGIIRFSYGHFFQIPNYENLYTNPDFIVSPGSGLSSVTGNPDLKPQKTVMYEIGLQQVVFPNVVLNFTAYYRDIRNLLGMEIINTYEGFKYARYINRDYGNVRGFIVSLDKRFADFFSARVDYTYQIAEGNASDPMSVFNNNQTNPPIEETKKVVPLNWDQRNTLNISLNVGEPGDWTFGFIFSYGSGFPYTEDIRSSNGVRFENGGLKPPTYNLDLRAEKTFKVMGLDINTFLLVYNLLDIKNENGVYGRTGRANVDLNANDYKDSDVAGLNTIADFVKNPSMYSSPREIRVGFGFNF